MPEAEGIVFAAVLALSRENVTKCHIQFHVKAVVSRRFTRLPTYNVEETGHRELRRSSLHGNYSR